MKTTGIKAPRRRRGFTLMELLLVLAIIGLLTAGLAVGFSSMMDHGKTRKAEDAILAITTHIHLYSNRASGKIPSPSQGLRVLVTAVNMPEEHLTDPWGESYEYVIPPRRSKDKFDVFSKGKNMIAGDDDDIGNWTLGSR